MAFDCYIITNTVNGKRYVGITSRGVVWRWKKHVRDAGYRKPGAMPSAIRKYGVESFCVVHVASSINYDDLLATEIAIIAQEQTFGPLGYNMTAGGEGMRGYMVSASTRAWLSIIHTGKILSLEHCANLSIAKRGKGCGQTFNRGRTHTAEARAKISAAGVGRKLSPERRANLLALNVGKSVSQETRAKLSASHAGKILSPETIAKRSAKITGQVRSAETRAKISAARQGITFSPEHRANISKAKRGKTQSPETVAKRMESLHALRLLAQ